MTLAARGVSDGFRVRVQELSISRIGAAATSVRETIGMMTRLEVYLTLTHSDTDKLSPLVLAQVRESKCPRYIAYAFIIYCDIAQRICDHYH